MVPATPSVGHVAELELYTRSAHLSRTHLIGIENDIRCKDAALLHRRIVDGIHGTIAAHRRLMRDSRGTLERAKNTRVGWCIRHPAGLPEQQQEDTAELLRTKYFLMNTREPRCIPSRLMNSRGDDPSPTPFVHTPIHSLSTYPAPSLIDAGVCNNVVH